MDRRQLLKTLTALPFAGILSKVSEGSQKPETSSSHIYTLQVILEGAFAVVVQKDKGNAITAFVPQLQSKNEHVSKHILYFNDPSKPLETANSYSFELSSEGLEAYSKPYINPGFRDFNAETDVWNKEVPNFVKISLPCPGSINFSGEPQPVVFRYPKEKRRTGFMPTSHIFEYRVKPGAVPQLKCGQAGSECRLSQFSSPGVARFFFGVSPGEKFRPGPDEHHFDDTHAVEFFNKLLEASFPKLVRRYSVRKIGLGLRKGDKDDVSAVSPTLLPAVLNAGSGTRVQRTSAVVDCQQGGIIVTHP